MDFSAGRCDASAEALYGWAERTDYATPFVADPAQLHVVGTIDLDDSVDATDVEGAAGQRRGRHRVVPQARPKPAPHRHVPSVDPTDVEALTKSIDYVVATVA